MGQAISTFILKDSPKLNIEDIKVNELEKGKYYEFLENQMNQIYILEKCKDISYQEK